MFFRRFSTKQEAFEILMEHDTEKHNQIKEMLLLFVNSSLGKDIKLLTSEIMRDQILLNQNLLKLKITSVIFLLYSKSWKGGERFGK